MTDHPSGIVLEIAGIEESNRGRACDEHVVCGTVLQHTLVCLTQTVVTVTDLTMGRGFLFHITHKYCKILYFPKRFLNLLKGKTGLVWSGPC
jgi:hypothetical protein